MLLHTRRSCGVNGVVCDGDDERLNLAHAVLGPGHHLGHVLHNTNRNVIAPR